MKIDPPLPQPGDSEETIDRKVDAWDNVEGEEAEEAEGADDGILGQSKVFIKSKAKEYFSQLLQSIFAAIKNIFIK